VTRGFLYFIRDERIARVSRRLTSAEVATRLAALAAGPNEEETHAGFGSAISTGLPLRIDAHQGTQVTIDVGQDLLQSRGQQQLLAIAQIVFTVTEVPGISSVIFQVDGRSVQVPVSDGTLAVRAVTRADYRMLLPPSKGPSPTASS
jgi:spore germination protein GerM